MPAAAPVFLNLEESLRKADLEDFRQLARLRLDHAAAIAAGEFGKPGRLRLIGGHARGG